ncbi:MAG: LptA/OstA family protein [bacterium]
MKVTRLLIRIIMCVAICTYAQAEQQYANVVITGTSMEMLEHGEKAVFTGGVKLERDNSMLLGDKMIYHKKSGIVDVSGNVKLRLRNESDQLVAQCSYTTYYEKEDTGRMWGDLQIIRSSADEYGQVNMYAQELRFDGHKEEWEARGDVHIIQYQTETWSEHARFIHPEGKLILSGKRPLMRRKDNESMGEYTGNNITILYGTKKMILEGNVKGWIKLAQEESPAPPDDTEEGMLMNKKNIHEIKQQYNKELLREKNSDAQEGE